MNTVKYLNCSMFGTYYEDCEILEKLSDGKYLIKYFDSNIGREDSLITTRDKLVFPKFSDLVV